MNLNLVIVFPDKYYKDILEIFSHSENDIHLVNFVTKNRPFLKAAENQLIVLDIYDKVLARLMRKGSFENVRDVSESIKEYFGTACKLIGLARRDTDGPLPTHGAKPSKSQVPYRGRILNTKKRFEKASGR